MESRCKEELQTCSMDESCQSGSLHEIAISRVLGPGGNSTQTKLVIFKFHKCFIAVREFGCTVDELGKSWDIKIDLIEESYMQLVELMKVTRSSKYSTKRRQPL